MFDHHHIPLAEVPDADLLRLVDEYRAMAATASTATDRDALNRVADGLERMVERRSLTQPLGSAPSPVPRL